MDATTARIWELAKPLAQTQGLEIIDIEFRSEGSRGGRVLRLYLDKDGGPASLVFDGRAVWFHSINTPEQVSLIYDYIEAMISANQFLDPPPALAAFTFNFYDWDSRQDTACIVHEAW